MRGDDFPAITQLALDLDRAGGDCSVVAWLCWEPYGSGTVPLEDLIHLYSSLLAGKPQGHVYQYYRGAARLVGGDVAGAEFDLRQCLGTPSLESRSRYYLARTLLQQGEVEAARQEFEQVIAAGEVFAWESVDGLVDVAATYGRSRKHLLALEVFKRVLELDPANEWALLGVPLCHKGVGDVAAAESAYRRALEIRVDHAQLLNDLALLLRGAGQEQEALELFHWGMGSGSADATENLGMIHFHEDQEPAQAAEQFARVLLQDPERPKSRFYRELSLLRERETRIEDSAGGTPNKRSGTR